VQQTKDAEMIGNMNEIIGIKKEEATKTGKTSIMTTSTGRTLKRKQDEEIKFDNDEVSLTPSEPEKKKTAIEEPQSEITITPIPKVSAEADASTA
jgi:hypothetical protein